jgi:hypothetical protein
MSPQIATWEHLCAAEPRLAELERTVAEMARVGRGTPDYCAIHDWCHHIKPRVVELVGWSRGDIESGREAAFRKALDAQCPRAAGDLPIYTAAEFAEAAKLLPERPKDDLLCGCDAYDVAYQHLLELLPDCAHEGWCW